MYEAGSSSLALKDRRVETVVSIAANSPGHPHRPARRYAKTAEPLRRTASGP